MLQYRHNKHSQNGEDGILEQMLRRLPQRTNWVCEFGACDGKRLSNTFHLVESQGYSAVYIECDPSGYTELLKTTKQYPSITPLQCKIDCDKHTLDSVLDQTSIPREFDVLSIDIDSYDYQVWESVRHYSPKIVVIEINSDADPLKEDHIHSESYQGTAFLPMVRLGIQKGYVLVCHTGNLIFIRKDLFHCLHIPYQTPETLFLKNYHFTNRIPN